MDRFVSNIQENWYVWSRTELAAYGLWRMNWVHPFIEGNGRTARAVCYFLLCVRSGTLLRGDKIVPERIKTNRRGYESALIAANRAWHDGHLDFSEMENYLAELVAAQMRNTD